MIKVKTFDYGYTYIATVTVDDEIVPLAHRLYGGGIPGGVPHPKAGVSFIRIRLFGPRGGPKDSFSLTKAQAMELAHALMTEAEGI